MRRGCAAVLCVAILLLIGCGGGSDSASAPSSATQGTAEAQAFHKGAGEDREKQGGSSSEAAKPKRSSSPSTATVKVPPISSTPTEGSKAPAPGVKTVKGGDNSVQSYGTEQSQADRTEAAIALQGYLDARLEEDWERVCSYLAQRPKEQLEELTKSAKEQGQDLGGCAGTMAALGKGTPRSQLQAQATIVEVLSLRGGGDVPGDPSYLIFMGPPGSTLYSMPMYLDGGEWKVGLAQASELPV